MDHFQEIFTLPESPMEAGDKRDALARQFINQFQAVDKQEGAVGGQVSPVSPTINPAVNPNPANVQIVNEYNSFNLANITPPVPPKWKQPDNLLDEFCKFRCSCQWIFDGPMCHITSGKVKTSMLLIWAGPDDEDIYDSLNLPPHQANDVQHVLQWFEEFCEPICNFRAARFKFTKVSQ